MTGKQGLLENLQKMVSQCVIDYWNFSQSMMRRCELQNSNTFIQNKPISTSSRWSIRKHINRNSGRGDPQVNVIMTKLRHLKRVPLETCASIDLSYAPMIVLLTAQGLIFPVYHFGLHLVAETAVLFGLWCLCQLFLALIT